MASQGTGTWIKIIVTVGEDLPEKICSLLQSIQQICKIDGLAYKQSVPFGPSINVSYCIFVTRNLDGVSQR